ncbi:hypothetical protein LAZ67_7002977 [Cordylochernes scorpioides]|uniref:Histone-lysine N-methyltransferase SETMAR n=1 Tax=Cordylochernes scorpioides TaxID=51811 RepID=A0ABY6KNI2_9ARAC|nr:hypothetical protein LAZ67_7002977 [Cordylochernes scorpioides]
MIVNDAYFAGYKSMAESESDVDTYFKDCDMEILDADMGDFMNILSNGDWKRDRTKEDVKQHCEERLSGARKLVSNLKECLADELKAGIVDFEQIAVNLLESMCNNETIIERLHHALTTCSYSFLECRRYSNISNMPKNGKYLWSQRSAGKVLLTIFWEVDGPICLDFLSSRQRMNSDLYCDILVNKLKPGIRNKRRGKVSKGVLFLHGNARPHTSCKTVSTIIKLGFEVLEHPAYSPDLAPSDYFLFGLLKKELKGKRFDSDEDVQKVVQDFFHTLPKSAYKEGIYKLAERWRRCIEGQGDYFE